MLGCLFDMERKPHLTQLSACQYVSDVLVSVLIP